MREKKWETTTANSDCDCWNRNNKHFPRIIMKMNVIEVYMSTTSSSPTSSNIEEGNSSQLKWNSYRCSSLLKKKNGKSFISFRSGFVESRDMKFLEIEIFYIIIFFRYLISNSIEQITIDMIDNNIDFVGESARKSEIFKRRFFIKIPSLVVGG